MPKRNDVAQLHGSPCLLMDGGPLMLTSLWPGRWYHGNFSACAMICSETKDRHEISYAGRCRETAKERVGIAMKKSILEGEQRAIGRCGCGRVTAPEGVSVVRVFIENPDDMLS